ncbi:hypothetical protein RQP53_23455 [Paucibacter sp. APW11]|uniref:Uncharacterized protein n=1 Tax=Roseateles aquae TaxID=3077235 RepID=A0ABU3PJC3_9BURK|nr:hypothetical protein [Paucibacter sp. APW11]MDT9002257.1 hypothetical protein [Paucibacter sp. APW11]
MKLLAYTKPDFKGELITVYEALRRKDRDPDVWENWIYYDIVRSKPMFPVKRVRDKKDSSSFTYKGKAGGGHGRGSKGIAHELAQQFLCKQTEVRFKMFGNSFIASVAQADDEVHIQDPNDSSRQIFTDVMLTLAPNCTSRPTFGDRLAIEITDTHVNTRRKLRLFRDLKIGALEVVIPASWHVRNQTSITEAELDQLKRRIAGFWKAEIAAKLIFAQIFIQPPEVALIEER